MAKIFNIFATGQTTPKDFSVSKANELVPLVKRYTEEAIQETQKINLKLEYVAKDSPQFKALSKAHDSVVLKWAERVHRLGGLAKGLWTVDFDNGHGFLCWSFPEDRIDYFHTYDGSYKTRKKLKDDHSSAPAIEKSPMPSQLDAPPPA